MIQSIPSFLQKTEINDYSDEKTKQSNASLKYFLKKSKKGSDPLAIISVHGSKILNEQLVASTPEQTKFIRITHGLQKFRSKPHFDLVFYSLPGSGYDQSALCESLCYCRMLLRPGGRLLFLIEQNRQHRLVQRFIWKKEMAITWLTQAGYTRIRRKEMGKDAVYICGERPDHNF